MTTVDEERQKLCEAIGESVIAWAGVEQTLSFLFCFLVSGGPTDNSAHTAFMAIENFRSKLQVVDSVFHSKRLHEDVAEAWKTLHAHLRSRSTKRNMIVHRTLLRDEHQPIGRRMVLIPSLLSGSKFRTLLVDKSDKPMGVNDVQAAIEEFKAVALETHRLIGKIAPPGSWRTVPA